jgi:putative colanic acid biosynthesis UDP-glucose lipid carrier transferase
MTALKKGGYSKYIRPISVVMDLLIVCVLCFYLFEDLVFNVGYYIIYLVIGWCCVAVFIKFYDVYRFTAPSEIISKISRQGFLFVLIVIAFFPFSKQYVFSEKTVAAFTILSMLAVSISKFVLFYFLRKYRIITGSNLRNVVIIGYTPETIRLRKLFEARNDFGYHFFGFFSNKKDNVEIKGKLEKLKSFVIENKIDEIYCSLKEVSSSQLNKIIAFAEENKKTIKFIPDLKDVFSKNVQIDYYDSFPVLSLKKTILNDPTIRVLKRFFDVVFSVIVIIVLLSWLTPLLAILIKLESNGPVFFRQGRPGIDENEFFCFKFRSMKVNYVTETAASKNDPRVTRIGRLMRKTSIDELPQFFNVLLGDMSVVGPRPHLWSQNLCYANRIDKYAVRHCVKPGITGLAQVSGFRGEIQKERDMINRIKFDIFYIENWSLTLDLKIIYQTVLNMCKGEEKAY